MLKCCFFNDHHCFLFFLAPIPGLTCPNNSKAGVPPAEMGVKDGLMVEMATEEEPTITGGSTKRVQAPRAGTATVTGLALDVGASQAEPTPAAATLG